MTWDFSHLVALRAASLRNDNLLALPVTLTPNPSLLTIIKYRSRQVTITTIRYDRDDYGILDFL